MSLIEFELTPVAEIEPWGCAPDLSLHWFGLSYGSYHLEAGGECQESCRVTGGQWSRVARPCPGLRRTVATGDQLRVWRVQRPGRRARASR